MKEKKKKEWERKKKFDELQIFTEYCIIFSSQTLPRHLFCPWTLHGQYFVPNSYSIVFCVLFSSFNFQFHDIKQYLFSYNSAACWQANIQLNSFSLLFCSIFDIIALHCSICKDFFFPLFFCCFFKFYFISQARFPSTSQM